MISYSIIQKSQLEGAQRLDAEYYQPEYLEIKEKLFTSPNLEDVSKKITDFGAYSQMNFVEYTDEGIRFLRNQDVGEVFINDSDPVFISNETHKRLSLKLDESDIVTPRVGTLGNAAIVFKEYIPSSANQNLAQIKPDESKIDPLYLSVFLCCRFGRRQFKRFATGNVQPWLNLKQIKALKVFVPATAEQSRIKEIVLTSLAEYKNSKTLYTQAEDLLLEELGLKDFKAKEDLFNIVNLSDIKSAHRIDADYFQPKYAAIVDKLTRTFSAVKIKDLDFIKITTGQYCEEYTLQDEGKPYIRGTDLSMGTIKMDDLYYIETKKQIPAKKAKEGDVVVTRVGTIGISARLPKEVEGGTISDNLIRMRFPEEKLDSYFVALYFNTIGSQLMVRESRGSVQARLNQETLKEIVLPILPKPTQQKIADLVCRSHEARKKAKELLEEAKRKVEEMIEKEAS